MRTTITLLLIARRLCAGRNIYCELLARQHPTGNFPLMKHATFVLTIFLTAFETSMAQKPFSENPQTAAIMSKLDHYLISAHKAFKFNGSALVAQKGKVLLQKGYGWSNAFTKSINKPETRFPILSITKPFTTTVILKLQEDGQLSVQDRLSKYFPDYPNGNKITIHIFVHAPTEFAPGQRYSYNNSGYFLLGLIIEKITGRPYESVVRELIFNPLGMTDSGFDFLSLPDSLKARGYEFLDSERTVLYEHYDSTFAYSAGSIYSTIVDLYKWAKAISTKRILSAKSWKLAFTPKIDSYGYGWMTGQFAGQRYVRHSGGYPGYMSEFIHYPDKDLTIILLNNFGTYGENVWSVAMGISSIAFNQPYDNWKLRTEVNVDGKILQRYVGTYKFSNNRNIVIKLQDHHLFSEVPGLPPMRLYAENEHIFYLQNFNTEYRFTLDESANVLKLIIHEHGRDYQCDRRQ